MRILIAISLFVALSTSAFAASATPAGVVEYSGTCLRVDGSNESPCNLVVRNLRFLDGYDSFQFGAKVQSELATSTTTAFVGSKWLSYKDGGAAARLGPTMAFMPLEQVVVLNPISKQQSIKKYRGQCVLEFKSENTRRTEDLKKIWCEYSDGESGHVLSLNDISAVNVTIMKDFREYK